MKPRVLIVGSACVELIVKTPSIPGAGQTTVGDCFYYLPGGKGTDTSVALARLGGDPVFSSKLGDDPNGKELADYLVSEGVDCRFVQFERGENTALEVVLREEGQADRRLAYPGAGALFSAEEVEEAFICYPDAVILHRGLPTSAIDEAATMAEKKKLPLFAVSLPDADAYPLSRLGECEALIVDEEDIARCTGIRPVDQEKCMKACMALTQHVKTKYVILRLGERGSFLYDGMYYHFIAAYDVPQPNGVTSEGAYAAAFVLEYLRSEGDLKRSCEFATIISAIYLTRGGGMRAYPTTEDVRRFILRNEIDFELDT